MNMWTKGKPVKRIHSSLIGEFDRPRPTGAVLLPVIIACVLTCFAAAPSQSQTNETAQYFKQNCASCHTIGGGRLTGPDLKDVHQRRDRDWLISFIQNPQAMINTGDAYALQILDEARGVVMPTVVGLTPEKVGFLLNLIEEESALEESQFKGLAISNEPFTEQDVKNGEAFFTGRTPLKNGGTACISCHTVPGLGLLGGGNLGPDLTLVSERLQGRASVSAWLNAPGTPIMRSVFRDTPLESHEIHAIVALFEDRAHQSEPGYSVAQLNFSILGLLGAALILVLFDHLWKERFRAVRRPMVRNEQVRGRS